MAATASDLASVTLVTRPARLTTLELATTPSPTIRAAGPVALAPSAWAGARRNETAAADAFPRLAITADTPAIPWPRPQPSLG